MIDINAIKEALPHRYPMLLVDRVLEVKEDEIVALKNVTINEPFFNGHFPEYPVMPGVLIMEALAQTAGDRKSTRLNSSHRSLSRMPSSA